MLRWASHVTLDQLPYTHLHTYSARREREGEEAGEGGGGVESGGEERGVRMCIGRVQEEADSSKGLRPRCIKTKYDVRRMIIVIIKLTVKKKKKKH